MKVLVSDFDGVICDGLEEYFLSSKLVYQRIWGDYSGDWYALKTQFFLLRPVVETGWEMPLLLRALTWGEKPENLLDNWLAIRDKIVKYLSLEGVTVDKIAQVLDEVRRQQIEEDLNGWLELHSIYQPVLEKINSLLNQGNKVYILTTKGGYFTRKIIEKAGINIPESAIIGKEAKRPKYESIREIIKREKVNATDVCFLEDRLETLELVHQQPDLKEVKLYLALWGYNTEKIKEKAKKLVYIRPLSLSELLSWDCKL
ncbi:MAG: HAD family hydrolase [Geminocystis sp.]|nr:HAD family hydrolase [Geminocystis sp.]HIK38596.1 HAD family hydrolase [Geminocystis sp. M7585_C2015_104]MCS7147315.1 HAD family hydrolase [Geminocystis sp.]MCX8078801.1 HAD family hydrolase [Geminocystis sp.]MDW8116314.1 HAD family hydrolase [Geminocystis sp.]